MKVLNIDYEYYLYPEGITNVDEFIEYVNKEPNNFIPLMQLIEDNCIQPFFIVDDITKCYMNIKGVHKIQEGTVLIFSREEYDKRLRKCISTSCQDCMNYAEDCKEDGLSGFRNKLRLDGRCDFRCLNYSEDEDYI